MDDSELLCWYIHMQRIRAQEDIRFISNVQCSFDKDYIKTYMAQLINIAYQDDEKTWCRMQAQLQQSISKIESQEKQQANKFARIK